METDGAVPSERLSGLDAAFLYLESKETPLHVAGVFVYEGPIPFAEFVRGVSQRLPLVPRYRQVVVAPPCNADYPYWEDDPHFDIERHIFRAQVEPPGGEAELEELAGRILTPLMDRSKPLWDVHVVEGLADGRGAVILRVHHALSDGIAGAAAAMKLITDTLPSDAALLAEPPTRRQPAQAPPPEIAQAAAGIVSALQHWVGVEARLLGMAEALIADRASVAEAAALMPEILGAVERLPFNKPCTGQRLFCWGEFDLGEVKAIRSVAGGTVNDTILAVLTRALARYVELHGQNVDGRLIRVVCPVNLRQEGDRTMGNQLTFLPVALPMDEADPVRMVKAVATRTALMKRIRAADFVALAAGFLGVTPPAVQAMLWRGISNVILPLPLFNIICTNFPGPTEPLYTMGQRLVAFYPQVPTGYELGVNLAIQSYCGKMQFGLIADAQVVPDVSRLREFLYDAFDELCRATGVRKAVQAARRVASPRGRARRAKAAGPVAVEQAAHRIQTPAD